MHTTLMLNKINLPGITDFCCHTCLIGIILHHYAWRFIAISGFAKQDWNLLMPVFALRFICLCTMSYLFAWSALNVSRLFRCNKKIKNNQSSMIILYSANENVWQEAYYQRGTTLFVRGPRFLHGLSLCGNQRRRLHIAMNIAYEI